MKFLCDQCKAKYQIADEKVQGKTLRMKCRKCGHVIEIRALTGDSARPSSLPPGAVVATTNATMQIDSLSDDAAAALLANPSIPQAPKAPFSPTAKAAPAAPRPAAGGKPVAPPRPGGAGATGQRPAAAPRPAPKAQAAPATSAAPNSALANAFNKSVGSPSATQHAEMPASNNPTDPPAEEWYVAIDEVPVGPIRLTDLRAKYGQGAVNDDSLVWREGFEEWRPLRTLGELHMLVREEVSQPRGSLLPGAMSASSKPQNRVPTSAGRNSPTPRPSGASSGAASSASRSNVIPFQRQAGVAARKLDDELDEDEVTRIAPQPVFPTESPGGASAMAKAGISGGMPDARIVEDPFASKPSPMPNTAPTGATPAMAPPPTSTPISAPIAAAPMFPSSVADAQTHQPRDLSVVERLSMRARGVSKGAVALIGAACLLVGVLVAVLIVRRMTVVEERVVEKQVTVPVSVFVPSPNGAAPTTTNSADPAASASSGQKIAKAGGTTGSTSTTTAAPTTTSTGKKWGGIDDGPPVPTDGPTIGTGGNEGALDGKAVGDVAQRNAVGVRKVCYEKLVESGPADAKINVHVRPDGGVSAVDLLSGSPPAFAACVQKLAYNWHFPASGTGGTFPIPFIFK